MVTRIRLRATRLALALSLTALVLATVAAEAHADIVADLEGAWIVAQATMNGVARVDGKVLNATWTFRGNELVVQTANGERLRAALSFEASAVPSAFRVTPADPSAERPLWIIWARQVTSCAWPSTTGSTAGPRTSVPVPSWWC